MLLQLPGCTLPPPSRSQHLQFPALSTRTLCAPAEEDKKDEGNYPYAADSVMRSASCWVLCYEFSLNNAPRPQRVLSCKTVTLRPT